MKRIRYASKVLLLSTLLSSTALSGHSFAEEPTQQPINEPIKQPVSEPSKEAIGHTVLFNLITHETSVDGVVTPLETPATLINDRLYVPVRFLSTYLGFQPNWDDATRTITFATASAKVTLKPDINEALINDQAIPFSDIAALVDNRLLLSARKMSELVGVPINYDAATSLVTVVTGPQKKPLPKQVNAKPIARFTTDKKVYRIGEPIHYIDLSYDTDGTGFYLNWSGKQDAYFTPGEKQITLTVKDPDGLMSEPFTQTIEISNDVLTNEEEYPFYFGSMDSDPNRIPLKQGWMNNIPVIEKKELQQDTSRKLVLSDSPEQFKEFGILYQEKVNGKARLYATHENETEGMAQLSVVVTNPTAKPIRLRTTHEGLATPSKIPEQQGQQAIVDWYLKGDESKELVIQPGQSVVYYRSGALFPQQGTHFMFDIETDGEAQVSFIANDADQDPLKFQSLKLLPKGGNVRGTFDSSAIDWSVDASHLNGKPGRFIIGDPVTKPWVKGKDGVTGEATENKGNYGVFYNIEINKLGKAAIALVPRGGAFKGTVLFNDMILPLPESGVVFAFQGYLIGRTDGSEDSVKLQVVPPSGSSLPFDILIYPLDNRK